jgi:hypothetical protein
LLSWLAIVLHCTVVLFLHLTLLLYVPAYAVLGFLALWAVLLALAVHLLRRASRLVLAVPMVAVVLWAVLAWPGDHVLGWTA